MTFRGRTLAAVIHASTTSGYVVGHREEAALVERLSQRLDVPAIASCAAAAAALRTHGVGKVQLVHPPWFNDEFDELGELGAAYFPSQGFALVTSITGLSPVGAAILAETGDPRRFATTRALAGHAGLAPREKPSGAFTGRTRLTRQRRPGCARQHGAPSGEYTRQPWLRARYST